MSDYENMRTADIIAEALLDWKIDRLFFQNIFWHNRVVSDLSKQK
jgi:hypothetical protein